MFLFFRLLCLRMARSSMSPSLRNSRLSPLKTWRQQPILPSPVWRSTLSFLSTWKFHLSSLSTNKATLRQCRIANFNINKQSVFVYSSCRCSHGSGTDGLHRGHTWTTGAAATTGHPVWCHYFYWGIETTNTVWIHPQHAYAQWNQ